MSKRKSNHDHDDFFLAAKADADEDREVRQAQEAKDLYKKEKKEYDQKKKEYDREVELWKIANENGQIMDPPMKPKKPKPPAKKSDINPADLEKRENIFKLARSKWGGQLRAQDRKNLMSLLGIECKTDIEGIIHVICPQRWLRDSYRLSDTKGLPSITFSNEFEPSTSAHGFNLSNIQREIKTEEKGKNKKIKNDLDWESEFVGKGKGKQKESFKNPESESDSDSSDTIPCSNITSIPRRTIKKEDSDVESDDMLPSNTSFRPSLPLQKKVLQIKQDIESDSDEDLPSNTSLKPSFISQTRHRSRRRIALLLSLEISLQTLHLESSLSRNLIQEIKKMAGPDSSDDDELLTADPIDFNRFKAQIKKEDEEMSSDDELPSNSHFTLPKPSQISKLEPIKDEKLPIEEEVPEPLAQVSDKIATVSASDRSPHEHRPSWPCTLAQKDAQPISLDSAHSIPAPMARFLRSYQVDGARFLFENFMRGSGALLGDDMGTGKTVQTIAFFMAIMNQTGYAKDDEDRRSKECTSRRKDGERKIDPLSIGHTGLLIVPATVIQNWKNEIRTWSYLNATEYGTENKDGLKKYKSGEFDILIVSHEYARDHIDELVSPSTNFSLLVIDEAHKFKNPSSTLTQSYHKFKDQTIRFGLTGTAVQNNLDELWCLLDLLNPRSLGDGNQTWEALVEEPIKDGMKLDSTSIQRNNKAVIIDAVRTEILSNVYLRRTKAIIKDELPQKVVQVISCTMTALQNEAYERTIQAFNDNALCECGAIWMNRKRKLRVHCHGLPPGEDPPVDAEDAQQKHWFIHFHLLYAIASHVGLLLPEKKAKEQMTPADRAQRAKRLEHLQVIFGDQNLLQMTNRLKEKSEHYCGKWKTLASLLTKFHRDGDKVLLFSSRLASLQYAQNLADSREYNYLVLRGITPANQRQGLCDRFNSDPSITLFMIATRAGGVGLNLTGANRVIIFDPSQNPAHDMQAIDRAFRIGQKRDVSVHKLISADSIEETLYQRQVWKEQLSGVLDNKVYTNFFEGSNKDSDEYGSHLWGSDNLLQRPTSSIKTRTAQGHHLKNIKDLESMLDDPKLSAYEDEIEEKGLRSILDAENQDETLARIGIEDEQDHLNLMAGADAVDIETVKYEVLEAWNSSQGFTESKIKQAKIPKAADDPSANKKRKVTPSETSNNAASRGPWAPPSRSGVSTRLQSTGSSRGAEGARRELADLLAHQKEFRDRPNAEELFQFIAEKENVSIPDLDSHLHKYNKADKQKFVSKWEQRFKQAKELARLKRRPSIESESDDENEDKDQDKNSDSDDDSD